MWHEVRKQERKIRCMIVDYKRRAERRKDYYEKIKADPTQFLQVHGRPCKVHLDPAIAAAGDSPAIMMSWQGGQDVIIDRFDVRAHLDHIPELKQVEEEPMSYDDRQVNYERYRILAQNDFLGVSEEKFLHQIYLEEQFGAVPRTGEMPIEGKKKVQGAAIGYNYEDPTATPTPPIEDPDEPPRTEENDENEDDSDLDFDMCVDVNKVTTQQAHELNSCGLGYGMEGNDFFSFLTKDKEEAESLRLAKELEEEKAMYSGRKSRRERRAYREKKLAGRKISPPRWVSYASRKSPIYQDYRNVRSSHSKSRSASPVNSGQITYITSFGGDEPPPIAEHSKSNSHSKSSSSYADHSRTVRYRSRSPDHSSRSRNRSHTSSRSPSRRFRSMRNRRSRSFSRSPSKLRDRTYSRAKYRDRARSNSRHRYRSRSRSKTRYSNSRHSDHVSHSRRVRSGSRSASRSKSPAHKTTNTKPEKSPTPQAPPPPPPVMRYYGRRKDSTSSEISESDECDDDDDDNDEKQEMLKGVPGNALKTEPDKFELKENVKRNNCKSSGPMVSNKCTKRKTCFYWICKPCIKGKSWPQIGNSSGRNKPIPVGTGISKFTPQERLKKKMQILLNRQFKADKKAEREKQEKVEQERMDREDEMRELSIKLRKRERMRRHEYFAEMRRRSSSSRSESSRSRSRTPSPPRRERRRRSRSRSPEPHRRSRRSVPRLPLVDY